MDKRIQKALTGLNSYIDEDRQRLCDRLKLLEKSHKRMMRLLFLVDKLASEEFFCCDESYEIWKNQFTAVLKAVHDEIERKVL